MKSPSLFVIDPQPKVRWPVRVSLPADGGHADFLFHADIRVFAEDDYDALLPARPADVDGRPLKDILAQNAELLPKFVAGWDGVTHPDGSAVPVSELPTLLIGPYGRPLSVGLFRAIGEVRYGLDPDLGGASEGNSAPPSAAGSTADATAKVSAT